jgi:hypothetical protein
MNEALAQELRRRFGPRAARMVCALPHTWRSTARRRRFLFLAACTPGFAAIALLPAHKSLWLLLAGTASILAAWAVRSLSEPVLTHGGNLE